MDSSDIFKDPVSSSRVSLNPKGGRTSDVWKNFGDLVYVKEGKQRTVGDQQFRALCLETAGHKDEETPFREQEPFFPTLLIS